MRIWKKSASEIIPQIYPSPFDIKNLHKIHMLDQPDRFAILITEWMKNAHLDQVFLTTKY